MSAYITAYGHLGRDPELRYTPQGTAVASFSLATSRVEKGEKVTSWWKCVAWGQQAETLAKYVAKGSSILVSGEAGEEKWVDKQGVERSSLHIKISGFTLVGYKQDNSEPAKPADKSDRYKGDTTANIRAGIGLPGIGDDVPF